MLARVSSAFCFSAGILFGVAASAREIFGVGFGFPNPVISLEFVNVPIAVSLALIFFAAGAVIGRRSPAGATETTIDRSFPRPLADELTRGHSAHVSEDRVRADRTAEKFRKDIGGGAR